jgi:hypothetical protein
MSVFGALGFLAAALTERLDGLPPTPLNLEAVLLFVDIADYWPTMLLPETLNSTILI